MISSVIAFTIIVAFFAIFLAVKSITEHEFCVICLSFATTWVGLSFLYVLGLFDSLILVALMAGMTIHGVYELLEDKVGEKFLIFRLPFLISILAVFYKLFTFSFNLEILGLLLGLWLFFGILFLYRNNPRFENFVDEVIVCCREW